MATAISPALFCLLIFSLDCFPAENKLQRYQPNKKQLEGSAFPH